ncbi:MAG: hypothetical protein F4Z31_15820 [Gemmatimonadetes bacterium]|nr:hypothetical protein [Gemmatimonadota bacterium]MCY3677367.1 hypothetical protein [Gemmatimonadota bacterium]MYA43200.1 hypothetical protein [Gemmatimonadota bacterium]MYE92331.1 hypothetical protein [Gemmatimonadota bacterium]MYJ11093.1 hypothetical protein [Gemmatimonadota bacterium]
MLPAEKKHYRKGLALGLTLAETFSIVVFILLLACAVLLRFEQFQRDTAEAQLDTARVDLHLTQELLNTETVSWSNADAWYEYARQLRDTVEALQARVVDAERARDHASIRAAQADSLLADNGVPEEFADRAARLAGERDSLRAAATESDRRLRDATALRDSLAQHLADTERVADELRDGLAGADGLTPEEAEAIIGQAARSADLRDSLDAARRTIGALDQELRATREEILADPDSLVDSLRAGLNESRFREDTLRSRVWDAERERDDAVGRAEYREAQLEQLRQGIGIDPPPCWLDGEGNPEYIFRIELTDGGMRLFGIAPGHRITGDPDATRYAAAIEEGREYAPAEFLRLTQPFYSLGVSRTQAFGPMGCRFWIRPVDRTGDRKDVFQERQDQLWRRFWFRW